ncbi:CrcB family protein [Phycisphaerales bacterium ac7]
MSGSGPSPILPEGVPSDGSSAGWLPPHLLAVAIGGAIGALLRHFVNHHAGSLMPEHPERATLLVNAVGSIAVGCLLAWVVHRPEHLSPMLHTGLTVGLLGALTTYSTFSTDALKLLHAGRGFDAALYVVLTTVLCIAGAAGGYALMTVLLARPTT